MSKKTIILNKERDVTLSPYIVTKEKKTTFLVCPGGAYKNCDESEAKPVAKKFNKLGYNVFVLRYSVGKNYKWPYPLEDFDSAMDYLYSHADEYNIDTRYIVAMGFSAGGHVVSVAASAAKKKPFAAVLLYGLAIDETLKFCAPDAPDASTLVSPDTCPCFLATGRNDWIVPVNNTLRLLEAFQNNFVDYESHIYAYALHGFSVGSEAHAKGPLYCSRIDHWANDCLNFIIELKTGRYKTIKECAEYNDKFSHTLSSMNSCAVLEKTPGALKALKDNHKFHYMIYTVAKKQIGDFMNTVSLRNLLELLKVKEKSIKKIDKTLSQFEI